MKKYVFTVILTLFISFSWAQMVYRWAGTAQTAGNTTGTARLSSQLNLPYGIKNDFQGNIWITSSGAHTVNMVSSAGTIYVRVGNSGNAGFYNASGITSRFSNPKGIAVGADNSIYVADCDNHVIRKIDAFTTLGNAQAVTVFAGKFTGSTNPYTSYPGYANGTATVAQFQYPSDVCFDGSGNLYVADYGNHCIRKITSTGTVSLLAGQPGTPGSTDGNAITQASFSSPAGLGYYNNELYVADMGNSKIRKINLTTSVVSTVVSGLFIPTDVEVVGGVLYITDQHKIMKYSGSTLSLYAGSPTLNVSGFADARGPNARFYNVKTIMLGTDSNLYVADYDNHVIRQINLCQSYTPVVTASGPLTFCQGDSVMLTAQTGFAKYYWSTGDTTRIIKLKTSASSVYVTAIASDSCPATSASYTIVVNSIPTSTFNTDTNNCAGSNHTITYSGNGLTTATYNWNFNGANIVSGSGKGPYSVNWSTTGNKTISLTVIQNACTSSVSSKVVHVYPIPTSTYIVNSSVCIGETDSFKYTGNATSGATYTWNFAGGTVISGSGQGPYAVSWNSSGLKNTSLTVSENSCTSNQTTLGVTVKALPTSTFTASSLSICKGNTDTITYTGNAGSGASFNWNFNSATILSGSGAGPYIVLWADTGNKTVTLTVTENGCTSTQTSKTIKVNPIPNSTFTVTKNSICINKFDTITYTGTASAGATYTWDFDGASVLSGNGKGPYIVLWASPGSKKIKLSVTDNGCKSGTDSTYVTVTDIPTASFKHKTQLCAFEIDTITFTGSAGSAATYSWSFGSGSTIISGSGSGPYYVKWNTTGNKTISLTVTENGCYSNTYNKNIQVLASPTATFTMKSSLCKGETDTITYTGSGSMFASYTWNFDGATVLLGSDAGPYILFWNTTGQKNVSLSVFENGCSSGMEQKQVNITNPPTSTFNVKSVACAGDIDTITYTGDAGTSADYTWNFGGGTVLSGSGQGPYRIKWPVAGKYDVSLKVIVNSCQSDLTKVSVEVNPLPVSSFTISDSTICIDDTATITFTGSSSASGIFNWNFGACTVLSGSGQGPYSVKAGNPGSNPIILSVSDKGCLSGQYLRTIHAQDYPAKPVISKTKDSLICSDAYSYQWFIHDTLLNGENKKFIVPSRSGIYKVLISSEYGCSIFSDTVHFTRIIGLEEISGEKQIRIFPNPVNNILTIYLYFEQPGTGKAVLMDSRGKRILQLELSQVKTEIDLSEVPQGFYFLKVINDAKVKTFPVIKQ